jgi:hypothetical protein
MFGQIAQLVEQRIENPRVGGSIPSLATIFSDSLKRLKITSRLDLTMHLLLRFNIKRT